MTKTPDEIKRQLITCLEINTDKFDPEAKYQAMRDALAYIRQLEAERDAAVADLTEMGRCHEFDVSCHWCNRAGCGNGCLGSMRDVGFEWRGVKEEEG